MAGGQEWRAEAPQGRRDAGSLRLRVSGGAVAYCCAISSGDDGDGSSIAANRHQPKTEWNSHDNARNYRSPVTSIAPLRRHAFGMTTVDMRGGGFSAKQCRRRGRGARLQTH